MLEIFLGFTASSTSLYILDTAVQLKREKVSAMESNKPHLVTLRL